MFERGVFSSYYFLMKVQAMPEECKIPGDCISAYRAYYLSKISFAEWRAPGERPAWFDKTASNVAFASKRIVHDTTDQPVLTTNHKRRRVKQEKKVNE